jgi:uncharacterized glyoxalase superfamily protein PhnB
MNQTTTTTADPDVSSPAPNVWHSLSYDDAPAAIEFLSSVFGFVPQGVHYADDAKTRVVHAQLNWPPGGGIMLGSAPRPDGWPDIRGKASAYCVTDEPDVVYERAVAAGVRVLREIRDEDYGGRGFSVLDPEGNQWSFGSYRGE